VDSLANSFFHTGLVPMVASLFSEEGEKEEARLRMQREKSTV